MEGYPITPDGKNFYAKADNRDTKGCCFSSRDVHSNPNKENDGVGTPEHLNEIGKWIQTNVSKIGNGKGGKGLWCTNCHNQLSRELYQRDNLQNAFKQKRDTIRNQSLDELQKPLVTTDEGGDVNIVLLSANPSAKLASLQLPEQATGIAAVPSQLITICICKKS